MAAFILSPLAGRPCQCHAPLHGLPSYSRAPATCSVPPATPAMDALPSDLKLNAVAAALASRHDRVATQRLLSEMAATQTPLEPRTLTAVIDAFASDSHALTDVVRLHPPQGFASCAPPNAEPTSTVDPSKPLEVSLAASFVTVTAGCLSAELLEPVAHSADEASTLLLLLLLGLVFDRYAADGSVWTTLHRGLRRLFRDDPIRAARVDAGSFLVAYLLGLPWLAYRPDARAVLKVLDEGHPSSDGLKNPPEHDNRDLLSRSVVWLCAGAAVEANIDGLLIDSSLHEARSLLRGARQMRLNLHSSVQDDPALRGAVSAAGALLCSHTELHGALSDAMLHGASVGECVALAAKSLT